jgi:hypothetical protein
MASLNELRKQIEREKLKQKNIKIAQIKVEEKARLKRQLFNLKHGRKIKVVKNVGKTIKRAGSNLSSSVSSAFGSFKKQRKSKTGIGGYLQRIADNQ